MEPDSEIVIFVRRSKAGAYWASAMAPGQYVSSADDHATGGAALDSLWRAILELEHGGLESSAPVRLGAEDAP